MQARIIHYGPWQIPIRCEHALCPDGRRRNVKITGQPDTYFTIPAKVTYRGKSVSGYVTGCHLHTCANCDHTWRNGYRATCPQCGANYPAITDDEDLEFIPGGKHADIFSGEGK